MSPTEPLPPGGLLRPRGGPLPPYQQQRWMTLSDLLLENRIVFLEGVITDSVANTVVMKLLYLQSEKKNQEISLYINSPGGYVSSTMAIYDTIQFLDAPVATYAIGLVASGAALLLAGGTKGKRFALPHATIHLHQPLGGVQGQAADIEIAAKEILRMRSLLNRLLMKHTGLSEEEIERFTDRDFYMTADQAAEYGIIDQVLRPEEEEEK
ncbi:MAG TPA: ATP-dependent Clp protease proteolytic subunit [Bacteroidetes bacterium]|nr:ATP-dependent Clp protease proteolytic subunit [Bacteroidota bacterium]